MTKLRKSYLKYETKSGPRDKKKASGFDKIYGIDDILITNLTNNSKYLI